MFPVSLVLSHNVPNSCKFANMSRWIQKNKLNALEDLIFVRQLPNLFIQRAYQVYISITKQVACEASPHVGISAVDICVKLKALFKLYRRPRIFTDLDFV